jgi:hypothetical protein
MVRPGHPTLGQVAEPTPIRSHRGRFSTVFGLLVAGLRLRWRRFEISDNSMVPTLSDGDWTLGVQSTDLKVGDVVIALMPKRPGFLIAKRIGAIDPSNESLWLLADNSNGTDSRLFGWVPIEDVRARLVARYHPRPPGLLR